MSLIDLDHLTRHYGRRRGIEQVSLTVRQGELFGFLGPNGAGKTTTIRVMLGFLRPTRGSAKIFGLDCWNKSPAIKREIGYLPGDLRLPAWMTGTNALSIFGAIRGLDLARTGRELAEKFDLDLAVKVREMSRGMRQKLGLILALAHSPRLLVLDEPSSGLDPLMQQILHELLRQMAARGKAVFFSSHSLGEVEQLCQRVAIVREGELVAEESLDTLRARAGHDVTIWWNDESDAPALAPPPFLELSRQERTVWQGRLHGAVKPLIEFLAGKPVADLTVERPDLESLFRPYYKQGAEERR